MGISRMKDELHAKLWQAQEWRRRQTELRVEIQAHLRTAVSYLQEASRVLDRPERAHDPCTRQQDNVEKRKPVDLMVSKVVVSDHQAVSTLREPFLTLSKLAVAAVSRQNRLQWLGR